MAISEKITYSDFDMSFLPHPVRKDIGRVTNVESVKRAMINLLMTSHYERPFHPEIGGNIRELLFEPFTQFTEELLQIAIIEVIENFEPRVVLKDVRINAKPDENGVEVTIEFFIENQATPVTITTFLERVR